MNFLFVFLGGGFGAITRYGIGKLVPAGSNGFPYATFLTNIISCIILGYLLSRVLTKDMSSTSQLLLMTGFCGGFSTFSTFSAESFILIQQGASGLAFIYIAASIIVCLLGIWLGLKLGS